MLPLYAHMLMPARMPLQIRMNLATTNLLERSNQLNPNNVAFWRVRGHDARPTNWMGVVQRRKKEGALEFAANKAAAKSPERKAIIKEATQTVNLAAKEVLGGQVQVHVKGSVKKSTDVTATSDLDLWIEIPKSQPMTKHKKKELARLLQTKTHVFTQVFNNDCWVVLKCRDGLCVDVVPQHATFRPKPTRRPTNGFGKNPRAREAVRIIKDKHPNRWEGKFIERAVQQAQMIRKRMPTDEIVPRAVKALERQT